MSIPQEQFEQIHDWTIDVWTILQLNRIWLNIIQLNKWQLNIVVTVKLWNLDWNRSMMTAPHVDFVSAVSFCIPPN